MDANHVKEFSLLHFASAFKRPGSGFSVRCPRADGILMTHSIHSADKTTYRKILLIGLVGGAVFAAFACWVKAQPESRFVVLKAKVVTRTAGQQRPFE